ncbi:hypothetical protein [Romboutsia sp. Marseille-P6047]|uniref:hypothetical protein n=1 Tax=Romboutsia sp. Marseille-P6047 TaxID=2161817 RepID=UPI000F072433|nr:hypothetical protein [Romboutsia sp. Marseille-P6047]
MEIVKIGEVYSDSIRDLSVLHNFIFINSEIHAQGDMILLRLRAKYENKFKKTFNKFNVLEEEELKKEFTEEMEHVYKKYEGRIKII